jgi:hypothetical protein
VSPFLRHFGEKVIRRSPSLSPTLTVSFSDSNGRNDDTRSHLTRGGQFSEASL